MNLIVTVFLSFLYATLNVSGAALIKSELSTGIHKLNGVSGFFTFLFTVRVITGFALIFVSALVLFKALDGAKFSFVIPVANGINFMLTTMVGYFIFSEKISPAMLLGLLLILTGIFIVSMANKTA